MKILPYLVLIIAANFFAIHLISTESHQDIDPISNTKPKIDVEPIDQSTNELKVDEILKEPASKTDDTTVEREEIAIKLDGLNVAQIKEMRSKSEKFQFQAEVDRMMKIIINSLYTNKEVFLRELISNASDALDKIRFLSLTDSNILGDFTKLCIRIKTDPVNNLLRIIDNGIGMTKKELVKQLGTIAKSGTTDFIAKMEKEQSIGDISDLIGQFGVGFYSVYLVAESVTVISKNNDDDQYIWESDSSNAFTVTKDPRGNTLKRGTEVVLKLKQSAKEYVQPENIRRLIRQYSQYLNYPIFLWTSKAVEDKDTAVSSKNDNTAKDKSSRKLVWDWEMINNQKPIWIRKPNEITENEYEEFYKTLTKSNDKPIAHIHFSAEGEVSFKALLYISNKLPPNFMEKEVKESSIRLYVRRVFITDKIMDMLPRYLSFIVGIVDSDDLPLNISRETLQQEKLLKVIQKKLVRKVLDMIKKLPKDKFEIFWKEMRTGIKIGLVDDDINRNRLTKLLKTYTSAFDKNMTSLSEYISRMKPGQENIYLICAESLDSARDSPFVEKFVKNGFEVLYFVDSMDEHSLHLIEKYEGIQLTNLAQGEILYENVEANRVMLRNKRNDFKDLIDFMKKSVDFVKNNIENIVLTDRLISAPMVIVPQTNGWTGNMERLGRSQTVRQEKDDYIMHHLSLKKNLELNWQHPTIDRLQLLVRSFHENVPNIVNNPTIILQVMTETALLISGYILQDGAKYASKVEELVWKHIGKGIDDDNGSEVKDAIPRDDVDGDINNEEEGDVDATVSPSSTTEEESNTAESSQNKQQNEKEEEFLSKSQETENDIQKGKTEL